MTKGEASAPSTTLRRSNVREGRTVSRDGMVIPPDRVFCSCEASRRYLADTFTGLPGAGKGSGTSQKARP
jgi:hypothetical protein